MKSAWIGIGFSHHSVPSLSNTATRSSTGTSSDTVRSTNSTIAFFAVPAFQLRNMALVVEARSGRVVVNRFGLLLEMRQLTHEVVDQHVGHVVREPLLDDHTQRGEIGAVGRERVG